MEKEKEATATRLGKAKVEAGDKECDDASFESAVTGSELDTYPNIQKLGEQDSISSHGIDEVASAGRSSSNPSYETDASTVPGNQVLHGVGRPLPRGEQWSEDETAIDGPSAEVQQEAITGSTGLSQSSREFRLGLTAQESPTGDGAGVEQSRSTGDSISSVKETGSTGDSISSAKETGSTGDSISSAKTTGPISSLTAKLRSEGNGMALVFGNRGSIPRLAVSVRSGGGGNGSSGPSSMGSWSGNSRNSSKGYPGLLGGSRDSDDNQSMATISSTVQSEIREEYSRYSSGGGAGGGDDGGDGEEFGDDSDDDSEFDFSQYPIPSQLDGATELADKAIYTEVEKIPFIHLRNSGCLELDAEHQIMDKDLLRYSLTMPHSSIDTAKKTDMEILNGDQSLDHVVIGDDVAEAGNKAFRAFNSMMERTTMVGRGFLQKVVELNYDVSPLRSFAQHAEEELSRAEVFLRRSEEMSKTMLIFEFYKVLSEDMMKSAWKVKRDSLKITYGADAGTLARKLKLWQARFKSYRDQACLARYMADKMKLQSLSRKESIDLLTKERLKLVSLNTRCSCYDSWP